MLSPVDTTQLCDLVEHMFDRLRYAESSLQKVRGAVEALDMWVMENADHETLYARPVVPDPAASEADLGEDEL